VTSSRLTPALWLFLVLAAALSVVRGGSGVSTWSAASGEHRGFLNGSGAPAEAIRVKPLGLRHLVELRRQGKPAWTPSDPPKHAAAGTNEPSPGFPASQAGFKRGNDATLGRKPLAAHQPRAPPATAVI
jgi:hypothetical protein